MSRSLWKGPAVFRKAKVNMLESTIISRHIEITPIFIGLNFSIYNGKKYVNLTVVEDMIGHKFGEFVPTRATFTFKKKIKKK